jgi:GntR family transcriptional repressor for pyruvate dehydrogenase complex
VGEFQSDFEPYSRRSAVDHARRYVTRLIALKEFKPGDRLPSAAAIGADIGVSRPVVLDALKILEREGRITVGPGAAGVRVLDANGVPHQSAMRAWMTENHQTITQMAYLREMVESGAARFAAERGMSASLSKRGRKIIDEMERIGDIRQEQLALDTDFHQLIGDATGMPVLKEIIGTCRTWVAPVFDLLDWPDSRIQSSITEHSRILDAILDRDPDEAAEAALDHVHVSTGLIVSKMNELASKRQTREAL